MSFAKSFRREDTYVLPPLKAANWQATRWCIGTLGSGLEAVYRDTNVKNKNPSCFLNVFKCATGEKRTC